MNSSFLEIKNHQKQLTLVVLGFSVAIFLVKSGLSSGVPPGENSGGML